MKVLLCLLVHVTFSRVIDVHVGLTTAGKKTPKQSKKPFRQIRKLLDLKFEFGPDAAAASEASQGGSSARCRIKSRAKLAVFLVFFFVSPIMSMLPLLLPAPRWVASGRKLIVIQQMREWAQLLFSYTSTKLGNVLCKQIMWKEKKTKNKREGQAVKVKFSFPGPSLRMLIPNAS